MSWDLYLIRFQHGDNAPIDRAPVRAVIEKHCGRPAEPPFDPFECQLSDGLTIEVWTQGLDGPEPYHGPMLSLRGYTELAANFIYDLARCGDMTILNSGDPTVLLTDQKQREHLPPNLRDDYRDRTVEVDSAESVHVALTGGYEAWRKFRDHVLKNR